MAGAAVVIAATAGAAAPLAIPLGAAGEKTINFDAQMNRCK